MGCWEEAGEKVGVEAHLALSTAGLELSCGDRGCPVGVLQSLQGLIFSYEVSPWRKHRRGWTRGGEEKAALPGSRQKSVRVIS